MRKRTSWSFNDLREFTIIQTITNPEDPNYMDQFNLIQIPLHEAKKLMERQEVKNPAVIGDASHDNAIVNGKKLPRQQVHVVKEVLDYLEDPDHRALRSFFKGFMVESFVEEGCQKIDCKNPEDVNLDGLSITDPCLGWNDTEALIERMAERHAA